MYQCPKCSSRLDIVLNNEIRLDKCTQCGGMWFDKGELVKLLIGDVDLSTDGSIDNESYEMNQRGGECPLCNGSILERIESKTSENVVIDMCKNCGGVWLDKGELTSLVLGNKKEALLELLK